MSVAWSTEKRQSLRSSVPSIVELIDRRHPEPDFAQLAEFNLPTRTELKVRTPEVGNCGRGAASTLRSRFTQWIYRVIAVVAQWKASERKGSFLEHVPSKHRVAGSIPASRAISCGGDGFHREGESIENTPPILNRPQEREIDRPAGIHSAVSWFLLALLFAAGAWFWIDFFKEIAR